MKVKNLGASPEAFGGTGSVRSVALYGGRPSSIKAEASFGVSDPQGMKIIGILLAKNEEFYVEPAVRNALGFCDELIAVDNGSTDRTAEILKSLEADSGGKLQYHRATHPRMSHDLIAGFAGTDTWVFGVDGDEIYDPCGLGRLRARLEAGEFANDWCLFGNVLNVRRLDRQAGFAEGHLAPPCRSMTKLYNFAAIRAWHGPCLERLHGGRIEFLEGFHEGLRANLHEKEPWEISDFRCLHLCFLPRSPADRCGRVRANIMDRHAWGLQKILSKLSYILRGERPPDWKTEKYARGPIVGKPIGGFLS